MTALSRIFFRHPATIPESTGAVIDWWESRRPIYNVAVGGTGVLTLGIMNVMFGLPPSPESMPWQVSVVGPLIYGTAANICYSSGWVAELFLRHWNRNDSGAAGAALFRYGFAFSIGVTLLPAGLAVLVWLGRIAKTLL
ncbi:MAG: hypothetical protein ACT4P6_09160 [Gemmatimonadaceae bacterium]